MRVKNFPIFCSNAFLKILVEYFFLSVKQVVKLLFSVWITRYFGSWLRGISSLHLH